jgi:hypothetical protein
MSVGSPTGLIVILLTVEIQHEMWYTISIEVKNMTQCSFVGCEKKVRGKGLCTGHWNQQNRKGFLTVLGPPAHCIDLVGQVFGRLTVISREYDNREGTYWFTKCSCGKEKVVAGESLKKGYTKSCGCYRREISRTRETTHGDTKVRLHRIWESMKGRCTKKYSSSYKYYGARGIKVCTEWLKYEIFKQWAEGNGYNGFMTLHRTKTSEDYGPDNCQWLPASTHAITDWDLRGRTDNFEKNLRYRKPKSSLVS